MSGDSQSNVTAPDVLGTPSPSSFSFDSPQKLSFRNAGALTVPPFETEDFRITRPERSIVEASVESPFRPMIYDFAVEYDNTIYSLTQPASSAIPEELSLSLPSPSGLNAFPFFDGGLESFGSRSYDQWNSGWFAHPSEGTRTELSAPTFEDTLEPTPFVCDKLLSDAPVLLDQPVRKSESAARVHSPTPSLSFTASSVFSSPRAPSPASSINDDIDELEEDPEYEPHAPSSSASRKRKAKAPKRPPPKKRQASLSPAPLTGPGAGSGPGRYPCSVPGCRQVCKTLGDLKRHENILAHKIPEFECTRCHYRFTRQDALKRHNKNVPHCARTKAAKEQQDADAAADVEADAPEP